MVGMGTGLEFEAEEMTLIQMHHEFRDGRKSKFVAQKDVDTPAEFRMWMHELWESNPPPEDAYFVAQTDGSPDFINLADERT